MRRALLTLAALAFSATAAPSVERAGSPERAEIAVVEPVAVDRVVAVVDEDPILASDLERVIHLGLIERQADESDAALARRALDGLIAERLRQHEVGRFGYETVPVEEVRESIRGVLRERQLNREIERWTEELRREADVVDLLDAPARPLPPVVETWREKPSG